MIDLFDFQAKAAKQLVDRFVAYSASPVVTGTKGKVREVPYFQFLQSLTASGKTVMMADAVASLRSVLPVPPVVLWLSRGKVVVKQTYANLLPGGRYNDLLAGAEVRALSEFDSDELASVNKSFVFVATVGTFNRKEKEDSDLAIYDSDLDNADASIWERLKVRLDADEQRRPLIVVYDEAHNLSDQQMELLLEQEPVGFILASATMRLPARLEVELQQLRNNGWSQDDLVTPVEPKKVADSGLIKMYVDMAGYKTPMEEAIAQLLSDKAEADADAVLVAAPGPTKAIYVCNTNMVAGDVAVKDDPKVPFGQRQASPILIWRYLVEQQDVDPKDIAVYCNLSFDKAHPPPDDFVLFKGANKDYANFMAGDYHHIIFNQTLQEGWDDPLCYFAYIDKSMQSKVQIKQIIGRVLRQPGVTHYSRPRLNTAHFYVKVDDNETFDQVLDEVERDLKSNAPEITFVASKSGKDRPVASPPRKVLTVPMTALITESTKEPVEQILANINDYRGDSGVNTESTGARVLVQRRIGEDAKGVAQWEDFETSNFVLARWIFRREVRARYGKALEVAITSDPKFDARIGLGSKAEAHIAEAAEKVVNTYLDEVVIRQKSVDPYEVGPILVRPGKAQKFDNSIHAAYDGLNDFEKDFARALDKTGVDWCRNPSRTGYGIPLVSLGSTDNFYPDFLAWKNSAVFLLDTKGDHIIADAVARKLLNIGKPARATVSLAVRFISKGQWRKDVVRESAKGFTLWGLNASGDVKVTHSTNIDEVVQRALTQR
jgi:type III restriction enzyme